MSINRKIEFMFNNIPNRFNLSLNYLLSQKDNLNLVIKNECNTHMDMSIFADNIILYDINNDIYDVGEIDRKDAVVLSKIAQHINPDTKYKQTGMYFQIKGW